MAEKKIKQESVSSHKTKQKKRLIILFVISVVIMIVLTVLNNIDFDALLDKITEKDNDREHDIFFFDPDYESNIFENEEYLSKNRLINYSDGALTYPLIDKDDIAAAGGCGEFFIKYFDLLTKGDAEEYNALFTPEYYTEGNEPLKQFTMQKIYNITAELIFSQTITEKGNHHGDTLYCFKVSYCIMQNDGTFRSDMPSDTIVPQYLELIDDGQTILINSVSKLSYND